MDQEQVDFERNLRRKLAIVASIFGVLFLFLSIGSGGLAPTPLPTTDTYRVLWMLSTVATTMVVAISYVRRSVVTAIVQVVLALATLMFALLFSSDSGSVSIGPSGAASIVGSLLVAYSASARVRWTPAFSCAFREP
jgi:hypothetical protein